MKRNVVIGLLASVLVVSIVSPALGGPSLAGLDKRVKTLKKRTDRLSSQMAKLRGRMDGLAKLALASDQLTTTTQTALLLAVGGGYYRASVSCPVGTTATGGGVSIDSGTFFGTSHSHSFTEYIPSTPWLISKTVNSASVDLGTKVVFSSPWPNGWQAEIHQDGAAPASGRVFATCTKLG